MRADNIQSTMQVDRKELRLPRPCTVCAHRERAAIDAALVDGETNRRIASRWGLVETSIRRHKAKHLPLHLVQAREAADAADADDLLSQLKALHRETLGILDSAKKTGDLRTALAAIGQARGNLELLAKLAGELAQEGTVNVILSPEWRLVRSTIFEALMPHPDARLAVSERLLALEATNGQPRD